MVTVGVGTQRSRARLWVEDQGDGIPSRERAKVWDAFYRLERHANSAVAGSGIGLYVVRELARMHGGDAWVEDAASSSGARFVIELEIGRGTRDEGRAAFAASDKVGSHASTLPSSLVHHPSSKSAVP
jgi:signal transduction histidine kinase